MPLIRWVLELFSSQNFPEACHFLPFNGQKLISLPPTHTQSTTKHTHTYTKNAHTHTHMCVRVCVCVCVCSCTGRDADTTCIHTHLSTHTHTHTRTHSRLLTCRLCVETDLFGLLPAYDILTHKAVHTSVLAL